MNRMEVRIKALEIARQAFAQGEKFSAFELIALARDIEAYICELPPAPPHAGRVVNSGTPYPSSAYGTSDNPYIISPGTLTR